jgi:hypothetical protein
MCLNSFIRFLATAICSIGILAGAAQAEDASATVTPLKVKLERLPLRCSTPLYRAYVTAETGKFTFLIPAGFRTKGDSEAKIKLANLEGNCLITFTILDPAPCDSQPLKADAYRDVVQARHPKGKIIEELSAGAAGRDGVGFDMRWETTNKFAQCSRTAFVPSSAGLLEFTATCSPKDFPTLRCELNQIMGSFQATTPEGKLEVPPITAADSDRSDARRSNRNWQRQSIFWSGSAWSSS